ncbi:MAG: class A beta-lactamase-related serine hydrolase [Rubrivivax sp.]|nr:class A beta-lactamase-related serine hydrolase [Rubrivivax sp.]
MNTALAHELTHAVREQDFVSTADAMRGGQPVQVHPSIDLALVVFTPQQAPRWANVLFSREHPQGWVADTGAHAGVVRHLRFDADLQNAQGRSAAWLPGADWATLPFKPLQAHLQDQAPPRFVAPYPASLLKLMVAVGVGLAVDAGRCDWPAALEPMLVVSDNEATDQCVALLHRVGMVDTLNRQLAAWGLRTLQLNNTTAAGGWRNGDGAGVGHIHMTAWDTARLLWLLDADAPAAPWLAPAALRLAPATRGRLRSVLAQQQLDEILSSGRLRGVPGWVPGLPDAPVFAHKTGTTENYASDAGIVKTASVHYVVAVLTNLGSRYAPHEKCATTWRLPALGAAVHRIVQSLA